ncbi:MAG: hypothetical protein GY835_23570, partial [bacterium]|nr:hypothetical protein [bacterium]
MGDLSLGGGCQVSRGDVGDSSPVGGDDIRRQSRRFSRVIQMPHREGAVDGEPSIGNEFRQDVGQGPERRWGQVRRGGQGGRLGEEIVHGPGDAFRHSIMAFDGLESEGVEEVPPLGERFPERDVLFFHLVDQEEQAVDIDIGGFAILDFPRDDSGRFLARMQKDGHPFLRAGFQGEGKGGVEDEKGKDD